jgi:hypothetical protein
MTLLIGEKIRYDLERKKRELEWWEYEWRDLAGYEGRYEVSSFGAIRNKKTKYILKPIIDRYGYTCQDIRRVGKRTTNKVLMHRAVAMAFIPNPGDVLKTMLIEVDHLDRDKTNNNVWNLEWVTPRENKERYWAMKRQAERNTG